MVRDKGAGRGDDSEQARSESSTGRVEGAEDGSEGTLVSVQAEARVVENKGAAQEETGSTTTEGSTPEQAEAASEGKTSLAVPEAEARVKCPAEREEEEIWEEIQRNMHDED